MGMMTTRVRTCARLLAVLLVWSTAGAGAVDACDVCAIYTATQQRESREGFHVGVAEQFSRFTTLKDDGHEIDNPGERLNSSITQLVLGYDFTTRLGLQLTLPVISRTFRRREHGVITSGSESGIGDLSLIAVARPFSYVTENTVLRTSLFAGLKFPTGSADRLAEEQEEPAHHAREEGGESKGEELVAQWINPLRLRERLVQLRAE